MERGDFAALMGAIVAALKGTAPPGSPTMTTQMENQILMAKAMQILSGDWTPFDTIHPTVKEFVGLEVAAFGSREAYAANLAAKANITLAENAAINTELANFCKEDSEPLAITFACLQKYLPGIVSLILDHVEAGGRFSDALKALCIELIGEWMEGLKSCMRDGQTGLQQFFQRMSTIGGSQIAQRYPQHAMSAMFGMPMLLNMMSQFHQQYRGAHGIQ